MPERHIIIKDFNLYHLWWGKATYAYQHRLADKLLDIIRVAGVELALPKDIITREAKKGDITKRITIDLI
jgi:hypothetical protein